jgi:hypothetical protein
MVDAAVQRALATERATLPAPDTPLLPHYGNTVGQAEIVQASNTEDAEGPTALPPFDTSKRYLGTLCHHGHDWEGTGQSLRNLKGNYCIVCNRESQRAQRQTEGKLMLAPRATAPSPAYGRE